jgi:hypothetical protein
VKNNEIAASEFKVDRRLNQSGAIRMEKKSPQGLKTCAVACVNVGAL